MNKTTRKKQSSRKKTAEQQRKKSKNLYWKKFFKEMSQEKCKQVMIEVGKIERDGWRKFRDTHSRKCIDKIPTWINIKLLKIFEVTEEELAQAAEEGGAKSTYLFTQIFKAQESANDYGFGPDDS